MLMLRGEPAHAIEECVAAAVNAKPIGQLAVVLYIEDSNVGVLADLEASFAVLQAQSAGAIECSCGDRLRR